MQKICTHCYNISKSRRGGVTFYVHPVYDHRSDCKFVAAQRCQARPLPS